MKYTQTIFFYLDDEELKDLDEKAVLAGITRSEYVRSRINEMAMLPTVNIDYGQFIHSANELIERLRVIADRAWHSKVILKTMDIIITQTKNAIAKL